MSHDTRRGTVIVLAQDSMWAAQVEAALHALAGWRVDVGKPRQLRASLPALLWLSIGRSLPNT